MKKNLAHLPKEKQEELELIRDCIVKIVPDVRMIVLFGSYARGNWVEDIHLEGHTTHVYESDFDILVTTKSKKSAEDYSLHDKVTKAIEAAGKVKTPLSIIYHTFGYVRDMLAESRYFFVDIAKEGKELYHKKSKFGLGQIKLLTPAQRKKVAEEEFKRWFKNATEFLIDFNNAFERKSYKKAAFYLHQAVESFYCAITLVFVNYRFRIHDIEFLGKKAVGYDIEFAKVFPLDTKTHEKAFKLLKKAYVDARYNKNYKITKKQLEYLAGRAKVLEKLTKKICEAKIKSFV